MAEPEAAARALVDRVLVLEVGKRGVGLKNVSANERHFRDGSTLPECVVTDALAQMTAIVVKGVGAEEAPGFSRLFRAREVAFRRAVRPGDQLILYVEIAGRTNDGIRARVRAEVERELVAEGEVVLATPGS